MQMNPRNETFCFMLKSYFCPAFSVKSFIFIMLAVDWALYVITLCWGISSSDFLAVKINTLYDF